MKKVIQISILISILLGFSVVGYWILGTKEAAKSAIQSIPGEPSLIVRVNDYKKLWTSLKETNLMWQELEKKVMVAIPMRIQVG